MIEGRLQGQQAQLMWAVRAMEVIREPICGREWLRRSCDPVSVASHGNGERGGGNREGYVEVLRLRCQAARRNR